MASKANRVAEGGAKAAKKPVYLRLALAALMAVGGCADRQGSVDAAARLAEATYPGRLEVIGTQLQKDHYDIIFAIKQDPFTRVRLQMDRDPSTCRAGTDCQKRLRRAVVEGRARGEQLKAMNQAFRDCEVPLLATYPVNGGIAYAIELDLGVADQQPALDRLANCTDAFADVYGEPIRHNFLIFRPRDGASAKTHELVTPDTKLNRDRQQEPSYWISVDPAQDEISQGNLRIDGELFRAGPVHDQLVEAATALLRKEHPKGVMRWPNTFWKTQLDPSRVDVVRTYLMACSEDREGLCNQDLAFRITHDLAQRRLTELTLLDAPQGASGLPDLPGRRPTSHEPDERRADAL